MGEYASYSTNQTHDVGTKKANAWGLHDFHGNGWEWCLDWMGSYGRQAVKDPVNLVSANHSQCGLVPSPPVHFVHGEPGSASTTQRPPEHDD